VILLALAPTAAAWSTSGDVWAETPVTVAWYGAPAGLTHDETAAALDAAGTAWAEASCGAFDVRFVEADGAIERSHDGANQLVIDADLEPGVLSAAYTYRSGETTTIEGDRYDELEEGDLLLADLPYAPDGAIDASCVDTWSYQALVTRAVGQLAGLDDACRLGYNCIEPGMEDTTMYPGPAACDTRASTLEDDDRLGIRWLYGHPFAVDCALDPDDPLGTICAVWAPEGGTARWDFGDGTTTEAATVTHTYAAPGAYVVTACTDPDGCETPSCQRMTVWAVEAGTAQVTAEEEEKGCATVPGAAWGGILPALLLVARRRRPSR
jgi:hypothetical protein